MADPLLDNLLVLLNSTGLQQKDTKLYQFLERLIGGVNQISTTANAATSGGGSSSGLTGTGTTGSIAQWSAATALTDVNAAGISAALDLL